VSKSGGQPRNRPAFLVISLLIAAVVALLLVEGSLRLLGMPAVQLVSANEEEFRSLPGIWHPGQDFISRENKALPYHIKINSLGYRGDELPLKPAAGEFRIFAVGDSGTFGVFVDDSETLPAQLESALRGRCRESAIRVVNAGLPGGTIWGEDEIVERGLVLEPHLVVLFFHENDLNDLKAPLWLGMAENRRMKSRFPMSLFWPYVRNTAVWNFLIRVRRDWAAMGYRPPPPAKDADATVQARYWAEQEELKGAYLGRLRKVHELLRARGVPLVTATLPGPEAMNGGDDVAIVEWAASAGRELGIPTTNLLPELKRSLPSVRDGYLLPHDPHASPLTYRIAANVLARDLLGMPVVQRACGEQHAGAD
jgi:hypothetical protein